MARKPIFDERTLAEAEGHKLADTTALAWALDKTTDHPDAYFEWLSTWARAGHDSAARDMLYGFCLFYERGEPIPRVIQRYLWLAFSRHLSDQPLPLEKALGLVAPAHRRKGTGNPNAMQAVAYLYLLIRRDGKGKQDALEATAARFHVSKRQVERFDKDYGGIGTMPETDLERLAQPNARIPSDNN